MDCIFVTNYTNDMNHILYIAIFFISALSYGQSTSTISGYLSDFESVNEPLIMAKVVIKENDAEVFTDENGFFKFENIEAGEYTLAVSFIGYETKESKIKTTSNSTTLKLSLKPSALSFEDLNSIMSSVGNKATTDTN